MSTLVSETGSVDWLCLPRPDSPPVFGRLLDPEGGHFTLEMVGDLHGSQEYLPNTPVLVTTVRNQDGSRIKITDFCPRFYLHGRIYRPAALFRIVEPLEGNVKLRVSCKPVDGWGKQPVAYMKGNSHLRFGGKGGDLRLTTNMPLTYLCEESEYQVTEPLYFALTWGVGIEDDLVITANRFLAQTIAYWNSWVKHCSIPSLYQKETIRSALTLKLNCFEDTGAILASPTTSLPEEMGAGRNWDYRFCWLRDAYFSLTAFHNLGHFEEMEGFIGFLLSLAEKHDHARERLCPVYRLDQSLPLPEEVHQPWAGYAGCGPVRSNNQAAEHTQNDVYGEMILTLAPIFFDERFQRFRTKEHEKLLEHLTRLCVQSIGRPDAGLWELRDGWHEHSFTNLMCWAGIERIERIQQLGYLKGLSFDLSEAKARALRSVYAGVKEGSLRSSPTNDSFDASLLLLAPLRFPDQELCRKTVLKIHEELRFGTEPGKASFLYRYVKRDDFGNPKSAFLFCSFWLVQALARVGETGLAKEVMDQAVGSANSLGLLSEHYDPARKQQFGNFPQAYSHVGLINAAFAVSPGWAEIL